MTEPINMSQSQRIVRALGFILLAAELVVCSAAAGDESIGQVSTTLESDATPSLIVSRLNSLLDAPPAVSEFHGFEQRDFKWKGVACKLVSPLEPCDGMPWVWRARFWGHEPQFDLAMLKRGWHVAYCDVADLFGNDQAVRRWDQFYELSQHTGLSSKPFLEGMSRGGLIVMRWASVNPHCVSGLYVDNAVMDIRSWPGGKGHGEGSAGAWAKCLGAYQMTENESELIADGPLDRLQALAMDKVPIYALINLDDLIVPPGENSEELVQRYQDLGGPITVHRRPGLGHHPHSLEDPTPLVNFATRAFRTAQDRLQHAHAD